MNDPVHPLRSLQEFLHTCVESKASDMHIVPGQPPLVRQFGQLVAVPGQWPVTMNEMEAISKRLVEGFHRPFATRGDIDGAVTSDDGARFRYNIYKRGGMNCVALRKLDDRFRTIGELGLPESLYSLCDLSDGLVIVAGPTGAGKSTTLAALLDRINQTYPGHMITIEDPIEYVHTSAKCLVNQRQVGRDCTDFNEALVASLRQDPDIILVGEIREIHTIRTAITAAETGHLVFTTVHAGDCVGVIERLVSVFPAGEQDGIRRQLALVMRAIIAQQLVLADGPATGSQLQRRRRVSLSEILIINAAVANLVATAKTAQIYSSMEVGGLSGMQTFEQDIARLVMEGWITETTAYMYAKNPQVLRDRLQRLRNNPALARRPAVVR